MLTSIPSKLFDYLIAGKPILYGIKGEGKEILEKCCGNIYFDPGKEDSLAAAIVELKNNYQRYARDAVYNKELVKSFIREDMVDLLGQNIESLLSKK